MKKRLNKTARPKYRTANLEAIAFPILASIVAFRSTIIYHGSEERRRSSCDNVVPIACSISKGTNQFHLRVYSKKPLFWLSSVGSLLQRLIGLLKSLLLRILIVSRPSRFLIAISAAPNSLYPY